MIDRIPTTSRINAAKLFLAGLRSSSSGSGSPSGAMTGCCAQCCSVALVPRVGSALCPSSIPDIGLEPCAVGARGSSFTKRRRHHSVALGWLEPPVVAGQCAVEQPVKDTPNQLRGAYQVGIVVDAYIRDPLHPKVIGWLASACRDNPPVRRLAGP